jgi:hypothetical protein
LGVLEDVGEEGYEGGDGVVEDHPGKVSRRIGLCEEDLTRHRHSRLVVYIGRVVSMLWPLVRIRLPKRILAGSKGGHSILVLHNSIICSSSIHDEQTFDV